MVPTQLGEDNVLSDHDEGMDITVFCYFKCLGILKLQKLLKTLF